MYELVVLQCCLSVWALALVTVNSGLKRSVGIAGGQVRQTVRGKLL